MLVERIRAALARSPVAVLTGPRQSGKTTLARELLSEDSAKYFDLEDPVSLAWRKQFIQTLLERVAVVYPGAKRYALSEQVEAVPLETPAEPGRLFARAEPT